MIPENWAFMSEIPPHEASWTFELMLEAHSDQELAAVLHRLQASMPPPAFDAWLGDPRRKPRTPGIRRHAPTGRSSGAGSIRT